MLEQRGKKKKKKKDESEATLLIASGNWAQKLTHFGAIPDSQLPCCLGLHVGIPFLSMAVAGAILDFFSFTPQARWEEVVARQSCQQSPAPGTPWAQTDRWLNSRQPSQARPSSLCSSLWVAAAPALAEGLILGAVVSPVPIPTSRRCFSCSESLEEGGASWVCQGSVCGDKGWDVGAC